MQNYGNNYYTPMTPSSFYQSQPQPQRQVYEQPPQYNTGQYQFNQIPPPSAKSDDASFYLQSFENYFEQQGISNLFKHK